MIRRLALTVYTLAAIGWLSLVPLRAVELTVGDILLNRGVDRLLLLVDPVSGAHHPITGPNIVAYSVLVEPAGTIIVGNTAVNGELSSFVRIDPRDGSSTNVLPPSVQAYPWSLELDPFGRLLFASLGVPSIMAADLDTGELSVVASGGHLSAVARFAMEPAGSIVAIAEIWNSSGTIVRIAPATGEQSIVSSGGLLVNLFDIAVAADGAIYATCRVGTQGGIVRVDPETGTQEIVSAGEMLSGAFGAELAAAPDGSLVVWSYFGGSAFEEALIRVNPATGEQSLIAGFDSSIILDFVGLTVVPDYSCPVAPAETCAPAGRSTLRIKASTAGSPGKLAWKWRRGTATTAEFGAPESATKYSLCAYLDGANILNAPIAVGGTCDGRPCWRPAGTSGFEYRNRNGNEAGLTKVGLRAGTGKARIQVVGAGDDLSLPELPLPPAADLRIQLVRTGSTACWESRYTFFRRNSDRLLGARSNH